MLDWLVNLISSGETFWGEGKEFVERLVGFSNDALHVLAGVLLFFLAAGLMRTSVQNVRPWLVVLLLALVNEWHDLRAETWPDRTMQYGEGAKDLLLTIALPTLILVLTRIRPRLFVKVEPGEGEEASAGEDSGDV